MVPLGVLLQDSGEGLWSCRRSEIDGDLTRLPFLTVEAEYVGRRHRADVLIRRERVGTHGSGLYRGPPYRTAVGDVEGVLHGLLHCPFLAQQTHAGRLLRPVEAPPRQAHALRWPRSQGGPWQPEQNEVATRPPTGGGDRSGCAEVCPHIAPKCESRWVLLGGMDHSEEEVYASDCDQAADWRTNRISRTDARTEAEIVRKTILFRFPFLNHRGRYDGEFLECADP